MKHFLYLLGLVFFISSCDNDLTELTDTSTNQTVGNTNFAEVARSNIQSSTNQKAFIDQQNSKLSLSESEKSKALETVANSLVIIEDLYKSYNNIGNTYYRDGNYDFALFYYLTSLDLKLQASDNEGLALSYRNIALAYQAKGDFENAAINFWQSYYLYDLLENASKKAQLLNDLGVIYDLAHDFVAVDNFDVENSLALDFYTQAIDLNESLSDLTGIAQSETNVELLFQTYSQKTNSTGSRTDIEPSRDQDDVEDEL